MPNRLTWVVILMISNAGISYAEVTDMTDPSHPIDLSSGPVKDDTAWEQPSYDCAKAKTPAEIRICSDAGLAADDRRVAILYRGLQVCLSAERKARVKAEQKAWIASRETCMQTHGADSDERATECLAETFKKRRVELGALANEACIARSSSLVNGFQDYRDSQHGFSITYPKALKTTTTFVGYYHVTGDVWRQRFWEHPNDHGEPVISVIIYRPNGDRSYPDSEVRIGVHPGKTEVEACGADTKDLPVSTETIHGQLFHVYDISNAGMSQRVDGKSYRTFYHGLCYAIESFSTGHSTSVADPTFQELATPAPPADTADRIVHSFRFLKL